MPGQELAVGGLAHAELVLVVCFDFGELVDEVGVVDVETTETTKGFGCFLLFANLDEASGCFR
jgi:hypothetical protein